VAGPFRSLDPRTPVLVGLGASSDPAPIAELLADAMRAAAFDAGVPGLLASLDWLAVPQGSWSLTDPARTAAARVGSPEARTLRCEIGVSQQEVINLALSDVAAGRSDTVVVAGAENRAWIRNGGTQEDLVSEPPDEVRSRPPDFVAPIELAAGIVVPPIQQYAMIENALAADEHVGVEEHHRQIDELWARCNAVATRNPEAAFPAPMSGAELATPGRGNRPLAFPYNRWHASQWTVDQATALIICSAGRAAEAGVPRDRWLFPAVALHSSAAVTLTARRHLGAWPAMQVLGDAATRHLGLPLQEIELVELYSCFPSAVRVQQRALGLDPAATPTITGGMAFAGGPFNHFVFVATRAVGQRLRNGTGHLGLVTTVSGMLSKPGLAVWSTTPPADGRPPTVADLAAEALGAPERAPVADRAPQAPAIATVVSFTATYGGNEGLDPVRTAIVGDLPDGVRIAASCDDAAIARLAIAEGLIGRHVEVKDTTFSL
jgi:acetyl-CoA C-acetyltransferase